MTNILMIFDREEPSVAINRHFFERFSECYSCAFRSKNEKQVHRKDIDWCDIAIFIRSQSIFQADLAAILTKMGRICALFLDDDFLSLKDYHIRRPLQEKALLKVLNTVDIFISTNDLLAERMCKLGKIKRYVRVDTIVGSEELHRPRIKDNKNIRMVYYTNQGIPDDFEKIIVPILPKLYEEFKDRIQWTFFTVHPNMDGWENEMKVDYIPRLPLNEFRKELRKGSFDIGVAPLKNTPASECKYINKFMEYSTAGIPGIYSGVEPYTNFIRKGNTGMLCNTEEEWLEAIRTYANYQTRERIVFAAQEQLKKEFSETVILEKFRKSFPELINYKAPKDKKAPNLSKAYLHVLLYNLLDPFIRVYARLKLEGFESTYKWIWTHYICRRNV